MKNETSILVKLVKGLIKAFALVIGQIAKIIYCNPSACGSHRFRFRTFKKIPCFGSYNPGNSGGVSSDHFSF